MIIATNRWKFEVVSKIPTGYEIWNIGKKHGRWIYTTCRSMGVVSGMEGDRKYKKRNAIELTG